MDPGPFAMKTAEAPRVVFWYRVYCGSMAFLYVLCLLGGSVMVLYREEIAAGDPTDEGDMLVAGLILLAIGLVLTIAFLASFFLPRARWAWIYHIVMICIGLSGCPTIFASLPLLIYWIKPETQDWYRP